MEKNLGYVSLWRKIQNNHLWLLEPFTKGQAWVDLFLLANFKDGTINIRGNIIAIKRGQLGWSEESLGERWKWSRGKVKRYLNYLETVQQIIQQKSYVISLITVINYDKYQKNSTADDTTDSTTDGHQTVQQTDTNNNVYKENNVNNSVPKGTQSIKLMEEEYTLEELSYEVEGSPKSKSKYGNRTMAILARKFAEVAGIEIGRTFDASEWAKPLGEIYRRFNKDPDKTMKFFEDAGKWYTDKELTFTPHTLEKNFTMLNEKWLKDNSNDPRYN